LCVSQSMLIDYTADPASLTFASKYRRASRIYCKQRGPLLRPLHEGEGKLHGAVDRKQLELDKAICDLSRISRLSAVFKYSITLSAVQHLPADNLPLTRELWIRDLYECC
jgi:hypothetical protein